NFNGIYQLPFGKGRKYLSSGGWANYLVGGWELSGIVQIRSGVPISFLDPRGPLNRTTFAGRQTANSSLSTDEISALTGVFEANRRIYWIDRSVICPGGTGSGGYLSPSKANTVCPGQIFFNADPGTTGNLPRAFIDGPGY